MEIIWVVVPSLVEGGVSLVYNLQFVKRWGDKHGLCEVLLQSEVKVSDLELLGQLEGCVGVVLAIVLGGARDPFIDRRSIRVVAPPARRYCQSGQLKACGLTESLRVAPRQRIAILAGHVEVDPVVTKLVTVRLIGSKVRNSESWVVGRCGEAGKGKNRDGLHGDEFKDNSKVEGIKTEQRKN